MPKKVVVFATSFLDELVTHPREEGEGKKILDGLEKHPGLSVRVEYRCDRNTLEPVDPAELQGVQAVIADIEDYDATVLSHAGIKAGGSLELIARYGVGFNSIDLEAATGSGVAVTNCPGCNSVPTAEWAHSTILAVAGRRILQHGRASTGGGKGGPSRIDISGRTLGVVGTGAIGKAVVKLMSGYRMKLLACDPFPDLEWAGGTGAQYVTLAELCSQADIITLHAAAGKTIIGKKELALMKPTAVLVNCARGVLVDTRSAYAAVKEGRIFGYGLDEVWTDRDLSLEGLNIVVSPHVGSDTDCGKAMMQLMSARAVADFMNGKTLPHIVNPDVLGV